MNLVITMQVNNNRNNCIFDLVVDCDNDDGDDEPREDDLFPATPPEVASMTTPSQGSNGSQSPSQGSNGSQSPSQGSNGSQSPSQRSNGSQSPSQGSNGSQSPSQGSNGSQSPSQGSNGSQGPGMATPAGSPCLHRRHSQESLLSVI